MYESTTRLVYNLDTGESSAERIVFGISLLSSGYGTVAGSCEHGNEPSCSIMRGNLLSTSAVLKRVPGYVDRQLANYLKLFETPDRRTPEGDGRQMKLPRDRI
jgi:hypothetical protein